MNISRGLATISSFTIKLNSHQPLIFIRGIKGARRIFRTNLPKYRLNLSKLPPLTGLLTDKNDKKIGIEEAARIRSEKLAIYKQYMPTNSNDVLISAIFSEKQDMLQLLELIDGNLDTMNSFYIGISFEALDDLMRSELGDEKTVASSPEFERLCTKTLYKLRFFESDDVLKIVKCLATLRLQENLLIVQATLEMIRHLINDFSFEELDSLRESLNRLEITQLDRKSLLASIKLAIPMAQSRLVKEKQVKQLEEDSGSIVSSNGS